MHIQALTHIHTDPHRPPSPPPRHTHTHTHTHTHKHTHARRQARAHTQTKMLKHSPSARRDRERDGGGEKWGGGGGGRNSERERERERSRERERERELACTLYVIECAYTSQVCQTEKETHKLINVRLMPSPHKAPPPPLPPLSPPPAQLQHSGRRRGFASFQPVTSPGAGIMESDDRRPMIVLTVRQSPDDG